MVWDELMMGMRQHKQMSYLVAGWFCVWSAAGEAWTHYRGPRHDGISKESIRTDWSKVSPKVKWRVNLGPALSSMSIAGGQAFTQVQRQVPGFSEPQECVLALDGATGRELWATSVGRADYPDGGVGDGDGPRSTPVVDEGSVYVLTTYLRLVSLDAASGAVRWSRDMVTEFNASVIAWQNAASPLVIGDLVVINGNASNQRLMAFRKSDGTLVWKGQNDRMTQATPVSATVAGVPQVIFFAQSGLVSVDPSSGAVLWRYAFSYSTSTAASPVVAGDLVYCSAAYGVGSGVVRIAQAQGGWEANQVWRGRGQHMNHWATPVHHEGHLYGIFGQSLVTLRCVELVTGAEKWRVGDVGTGGVLMVSGLVLVLTEDGQLVLVEPNPAAYTEVGRVRATTRGKCWNVPAVSDGRIYVRSTEEAVCVDVAVELPDPNLKSMARWLGRDGFEFTIQDVQGMELSPAQVELLGIYASDGLGEMATDWKLLPLKPEFREGAWHVLDPEAFSHVQRFYRVEKRR